MTTTSTTDDGIGEFVELDRTYFVWSDGTEIGPFRFDDFYESFRDGKFPKGFLWRRGDVDTYSQPNEIEWEHTRLYPPPKVEKPTPPRRPVSRKEFLDEIRKGTQYRSLRFVIGLFASALEIGGGVIIWEMIALSRTFGADRADQKLWVVIFLVGGALWTVIVAAIHQLALLAVDAVDIMIASGRDRAAQSRSTDPS